MSEPQANPLEPTPVDNVRRVRERLDREAQGNLHALAKQSRAAVERYRGQLDLKLIAPPVRETSQNEKLG